MYFFKMYYVYVIGVLVNFGAYWEKDMHHMINFEY